MISHTEVFRNFLLDTGVEDALEILLGQNSKKYVKENYNIPIRYWKYNGQWTNEDGCLETSGKYFFMKMAMTAWDFLNVSNVFRKS